MCWDSLVRAAACRANEASSIPVPRLCRQGFSHRCCSLLCLLFWRWGQRDWWQLQALPRPHSISAALRPAGPVYCVWKVNRGLQSSAGCAWRVPMSAPSQYHHSAPPGAVPGLPGVAVPRRCAGHCEGVSKRKSPRPAWPAVGSELLFLLRK